AANAAAEPIVGPTQPGTVGEPRSDQVAGAVVLEIRDAPACIDQRLDQRPAPDAARACAVRTRALEQATSIVAPPLPPAAVLIDGLSELVVVVVGEASGGSVRPDPLEQIAAPIVDVAGGSPELVG